MENLKKEIESYDNTENNGITELLEDGAQDGEMEDASILHEDKENALSRLAQLELIRKQQDSVNVSNMFGFRAQVSAKQRRKKKQA